MSKMKFCLIFCLIALSSVCSGDDVVVQMFSKSPINVISDKYISYSIDPTELLEMNQEKKDNFLYRMLESGPCYLKIFGNNTNRMRLNGDAIDLNASKLSLDRLKNVYEVMRSAGIKPVMALPYDPKRWNTRNVMRILGKVSQLEMNDITWQLGADFHAKDAISYIDDLNTLRLIVGAFSTGNSRKNWSVVGSDITVGSSEYEARMYSEFSKYTVDAVGWSQSTDLSYSDENVDDFFSTLNIDPALRTLLNGDAPVWLSLQQKTTNLKNPLVQMKEGLNWAQTLGDAAKNGFKVIYTPIDKKTFYEPSMSYYTTLLHKRIIGQTVFDTKMFAGNRFDSHFYAHCTKNMSGSFTIFGVNAADSSLDITAKLPFRSGTQFVEFLLTVGVNGKVYLNGAEIIEPTVLTPLARTKLPGKNAILTMPAHSVAFWIFTSANIPECVDTDVFSFDMERTEEKTSSERLLQQLILESVSQDEKALNAHSDENSIGRSKREAAGVVVKKSAAKIDRIRRNVANNIGKHSAYNAIELNEGDLSEQTRDKRFVGDGKLANQIYNNLDDLKRRNLLAPYKNKLGIPGKRMKREINMFKNLFDKFDLKKPVFSFKTPSIFSAKNLIPSITTVHDVLKPDVYSQEKKLFETIDNPDLPSGDVHFELSESIPMQNEYAASLADGIKAAPQFTNPQPPSVPLSVTNAASSPSYDMYGNADVQVSSNAGPPTVLPMGELTEMDVKPELVTVAPIQMPPPVPAPQQPQTVQPIQHHLQYVVKDLPPTWQVNLQNMEKVRNNLRQNLWPMNTNTPSVNAKISTVLPSVGPALTVQPPDNVEHVFFESKRRRRSIDSRMNDEIERRIQRADELSSKQSEQDEIFTKVLRLLDELESRKQNGLQKSGDGIRKLIARKRLESSSRGDAPKKCKVLSMAMEQQCLQNEDQPKAIFKRATQPGPIKKMFAKFVDVVKKPFKRQRERRSIDNLLEDYRSEENEISRMPNEYFTEKNDGPRKFVHRMHNESNKPNAVDGVTTSTTTTSTTEPSPATEATTPQENSFIAQNEAQVNKFLRSVQGTVTNVAQSVLHQVGRWWLWS